MLLPLFFVRSNAIPAHLYSNFVKKIKEITSWYIDMLTYCL